MIRRDFLIGAGCLCAAQLPALAQQESGGCVRSATAASRSLIKVLRTSSNSQIDEICRAELARLNRHFNVNPMFGFYDDVGGANAYAEQKRYSAEHPDGAVLMGVKFANSLLAVGDVALRVIMAHEWCHIRQYKRKTKFVWSVRYELEADAAAGEYLKALNPDEAYGEGAAQVFLSIGDSNFKYPNHHGTPRQRADVFRDAFGIETGIARRGPAN